ncbi:MAG TPA: hypothetical protein VE978_26790 [Chitinophagales bacterium]|nr:hypothetical protein [Chitinophagales bacterium]
MKKNRRPCHYASGQNMACILPFKAQSDALKKENETLKTRVQVMKK